MLPAVCRKMIRDYGEKRIKAPSLYMNNTEQISLKVGALPHSTLHFVGLWGLKGFLVKFLKGFCRLKVFFHVSRSI